MVFHFFYVLAHLSRDLTSFSGRYVIVEEMGCGEVGWGLVKWRVCGVLFVKWGMVTVLGIWVWLW